MKYNIVLLFLGCSLVFSCSKDDKTEAENDISGLWRATHFVKADIMNTNVHLTAETLERLASEKCYILSFDFGQDMTVTSENAINYLVFNSNSSGLVVDCPTQKDSEIKTYSYNGKILTIVDASGVAKNIKVRIDGTDIYVDATDLNLTNLSDAGDIIFSKF